MLLDINQTVMFLTQGKLTLSMLFLLEHVIKFIIFVILGVGKSTLILLQHVH